MTTEDCFLLGVISKTYSFKGEVVLYIDADEPSKYYDMDSILIEINNELVPHFIEKTKPQKANELRIKLENINTEEDTQSVVKKKVYLPLDMLPDLGEDDFYFHEVVGFTVLDQNDNEVGTVISVIDNPSNPLLEVNFNEKEAYYPFHEKAIIKVNKTDSFIKLDLPEGILDLYQ